MGTTSDDFRRRKEFQLGRNGERIVAALLQQRGYFVIPSYDYAGEEGQKAPKMQGQTSAFILPDFDVAKDGQRLWVEVKTKESATLYRKRQQWEHGVPLRLYTDYRWVQSTTGAKVHLAIVEQATGTVLLQSLDALALVKRMYAGNKMSGGGMVFFPRDAFKILHA